MRILAILFFIAGGALIARSIPFAILLNIMGLFFWFIKLKPREPATTYVKPLFNGRLEQDHKGHFAYVVIDSRGKEIQSEFAYTTPTAAQNAMNRFLEARQVYAVPRPSSQS